MSKEKLTDVSSVLRAAAAAKAEYLSNNSWITSLFTAARATKIRILIVADGKIDFKDSEFGLSELCSSLAASSTPQEQFEITTAHRSTVDTGAQIPGFKFDTDPAAPFRPFGIENYEQVWLFGSLGQPSDL